MPAPERWFVVVNPAAGAGRGARGWPALARELARHHVEYDTAATNAPGHATLLARDAVQRGFRRVLAVGGDGVLHEVVNGVMQQDAVPPPAVAIGALPLGSGNDWARGQGIPADVDGMAHAVATGRLATHDIGRLQFRGGSGQDCHFINVAGAGLDARVIEHLPRRGPRRLAYLVGLARALTGFTAPAFDLGTDGPAGWQRLLLVLAAIGPYCGGGMRLAPAARGDDGLLDLVTIAPVRLPGDLLRLGRLFDGKLLDEPFVRHRLVAAADLDADTAVPVQADGQLVGHTPVRVSLLPGAIRALRA